MMFNSSVSDAIRKRIEYSMDDKDNYELLRDYDVVEFTFEKYLRKLIKEAKKLRKELKRCRKMKDSNENNI